MVERVKAAWQGTQQFLREVRGEVRKVTWPGREEVIGSTLVVIVSVGLMSVFLGLVDLVLRGVLSYVIR
jgi:preprotein translocase subunit SecE